MTAAHLVVLLPVLAGCTETIQLAPDPLAALVAIDVVPASATVTIEDLAAPHHTLQYAATGQFADGTTRDVTGLVTWSTDNLTLGGFEDTGLFVASHVAAGRTVVTARAGDLAATAALTVRVDTTIVDPTFPPPGANLFDPAHPVITGDPTRAPDVLYPSDGTMFPASIARTLFQYSPGSSASDAFQLRFTSDVLDLVIETGADRWQASGVLQRVIASAGLEQPVLLEVRGTSSTGDGTVYAGSSRSLAFSRDVPGGPLYFWSAATSGILRTSIEAEAASKLYPADDTTCVGCHSLSRDGRSLAMGYESGASFALQTIDLVTMGTTIAASPARPMGWATYSPDGTRLVVAESGSLTVYDARTGANLGPVPLPANRYATHPDWSPDGAYLAVALTSQAPGNLDVRAASIARIAYNDGAWGTPVILVGGSSTNNNYFPRWSPDGTYIAYVHASSGSEGAADAELRLVGATGGSSRVLALASHRVGTADLPELANTMPTWGPRVGERLWLAFVSTRPYGSLLGAAPGRRQIWVTSLDLTEPADPSTPAFWLPSQDVTVLNYNPTWSSLVVTQ